MATSLTTYILWKVMVKKVECFQGSWVEAPPNLKTQADRASWLRKSEGRRMRPARRPGLLPAKAAFFRFRGNFCTKIRVFDAFWKFPLPRELNPRLPLFREGRDRLYQAPTFHFLCAGCATGQKLRRDLGKISEMCQSVAYLHHPSPLVPPLHPWAVPR